MKKDTSVIPSGQYCYTYDKNKIYKPCPYYRVIEDRPKQYNGWCDYLEKGDLELEKEMVFKDMKTDEEKTGDELPFPVSLLFDQCKECGINDNIDENELL